MREFIKIYLTFARIGAFTIGGGYTMIPLFSRDIVEKKGWISETELLDYISVCQCLPGIFAVNTSVLIGHSRGGRAGGIAAGLGMVSPSVLIILIIASFIANLSDIPAVQHAFSGIRVCVCVLVINAVIKLLKSAIVDKPSLALYLIVIAVTVFTTFPVALIVIAAGILGIVISELRNGRKK